jgi:PAS domain S-box-containing protein
MAVPSRPAEPTTPSFIKVTGAFLVLFNLMAIAFAIWTLVLNRQHYRERAVIQTMNLAQVLEQNVSGSVQRIDLVIQSIKDEAERDSRGSRLDALIQAQTHRSGLLSLLQTADSEGRITHSTQTASKPSVGDRDFFLQLKQAPQDMLFISRPFQESPVGAWNLAFARRLDRPDGGFGGVVFGYLPLTRLTQALSQLNVGRYGAVSLRGADLSLLARYPEHPEQPSITGSQQVFAEYLAAVRSGRPSIQFTALNLDGQRRTYTLQRIESIGFYILVGLGETDYLEAWRHQVAFAILAILGLVVLTLVIGWQARSSWIRHQTDKERLAAEESKYRLLAENALDVVWTLDLDGNLIYVSPSIARQQGWTPEEFMKLDPDMRALSGEYAARIQERIATVRQLPPGSQPFERELLQVAVQRKDGQEILVEAQWRVVWGEDGQPLGFQGVTRDVTERKHMEAERDKLIQDLTQALAEVKALSGLLPICSQCKKVRDDHGYWNQIEAYISEHSEATFTHGLCPTCAQAFREEIHARRASKEDEADA